MQAPRFGGFGDGDGKGEGGSDDMTSDADDDTEDYVQRQSDRANGEGFSASSVDLKVGNPLGVAETTSIGPVEDQCTVPDVWADVDTTSQLEMSVLETASHSPLILHISDDDIEDPTALSSKQVDVGALDLSSTNHLITSKVSVMFNINYSN